jgi:hypothetical protein
MNQKKGISRRDFLRLTTAGGAGLVAGKYLFNISKAYGIDFPKMGNINPAIPNTWIAHLTDPKMTNGEVEKNWAAQNKATNADTVGLNMDSWLARFAGKRS